MNKVLKKSIKKILAYLDKMLAKIPFNGSKLYVSFAVILLGTAQVFFAGTDPTLSGLLANLIEELRKLLDVSTVDTGISLAVLAAVHKIIKYLRK